MILVDEEDQSKNVMIIGKVGTDTFNMEINFPLSPRVAMGIVDSCFDFKWVSQ